MAEASALRLGGHSYGPYQRLVMAIVNRTPDSFYDKGATYELGAAMQRVHEVVAVGADVVDVGGVKAAPGAEVSPEEEIRRIADLIAAVRAAYPDLVISVDTYRHEVAEAGCAAGANLINDAWGGVDDKLLEVERRAWCCPGLLRTPVGYRPVPGHTGSPTTT